MRRIWPQARNMDERVERMLAEARTSVNPGESTQLAALLLNRGTWECLERRAEFGQSRKMKLSVTIDRDEDGVWVAECPSIPGCVSQGKTKKQALKNIEEAIALCLEVRAERGLPLTIETRQVEVSV
jgi:predicted RNase H-like HicB family nuclease